MQLETARFTLTRIQNNKKMNIGTSRVCLLYVHLHHYLWVILEPGNHDNFKTQLNSTQCALERVEKDEQKSCGPKELPAVGPVGRRKYFRVMVHQGLKINVFVWCSACFMLESIIEVWQKPSARMTRGWQASTTTAGLTANSLSDSGSQWWWVRMVSRTRQQSVFPQRLQVLEWHLPGLLQVF